MDDQPYPDGLDCVWLASDGVGHVAAFITAGEGPIAANALSARTVPVSEVEERLDALPLASEVRLLVRVPQPEGFTDLARRGLFVYDWTEAPRTRRFYAMVASPVRPVHITQLPPALQHAAARAQLAALVFAETAQIDIGVHTRCVDPPPRS